MAASEDLAEAAGAAASLVGAAAVSEAATGAAREGIGAVAADAVEDDLTITEARAVAVADMEAADATTIEKVVEVADSGIPTDHGTDMEVVAEAVEEVVVAATITPGTGPDLPSTVEPGEYLTSETYWQ